MYLNLLLLVLGLLLLQFTVFTGIFSVMDSSAVLSRVGVDPQRRYKRSGGWQDRDSRWWQLSAEWYQTVSVHL